MRIEIQGNWLVDTETNTPVHLRQLRPLAPGEVVMVDDFGNGKARVFLTQRAAVKERLKAVIAQDRERDKRERWVHLTPSGHRMESISPRLACALFRHAGRKDKPRFRVERVR